MATGTYSTQTTNFPGTFFVQSDGFIQGMAEDNVATRYLLSQGVLGPNELLPMFGGVAVTESIQTSVNNDSLGSVITRATSAAAITGFAVFDQSHAAPISAFSNVPLIGSNDSVMYYRLGSNAKIAVAIAPEVAGTLQGGAITQPVTWDLNAQRIVASTVSGGTNSVASITANYVAAVPGAAAYWNMVVVLGSDSENLVQAVGDVVNLSGCTNANGAYVNQNQIVTSYSSSTSFSFQIANGSSSLFTNGGTLSGTIVANYSGGALPAKIIKVNIGNSKIVNFNQATNTANWLQGQSCALIQI